MLEFSCKTQFTSQKESAVPYAVRLARETDVSQLAEIEKEAFPTTWPSTHFRRELSNKLASFLVAYETTEDAQVISPASPDLVRASKAAALPGLRWLWRHLLRSGAQASLPADFPEHIAGYVATW